MGTRVFCDICKRVQMKSNLITIDIYYRDRSRNLTWSDVCDSCYAGIMHYIRKSEVRE